MNGLEKSRSCDRLRHLVHDIAGRYPDLLQDAPLLRHLAKEVGIYQIELEVQNAELRRAQEEIEASRHKYVELYDFAPVAYFTLDQKGLIKEANLAGASLVSCARPSIIGAAFTTFVDPRYVNSFLLHLEKAEKSDNRVACELVLQRKDLSPVPVLVESIAAKDDTGRLIIRSMMSDIGELQELKDRLRFEELLSDLSTRFISIPDDQVDSEIDAALQHVLRFFQADRCGMLEVEQDNEEAWVSHAAYGEGIEHVSPHINLATRFPWAYERMVRQAEIICFSRPDELPAEAEQDRKSHLEMGIYSWLTIPLKVGDRVTRMISINTMREERLWRRDYIPRLRLLGELFANSLERRRKEQELIELRQQLERENIYLREEVKTLFQHEEIVGRSDALKRVLVKAEQVAPTDSTVLILGETGTGKELVARCIHKLSKRKDRVMVKVNCASLPAALVESELFGREKGAYTGALSRQIGRFEIAHGSTIFLDEIGELTPELQAKLLMVLQDGEFERLGSPHTIRVDVRVIAATNRDLAEAVRKGTFREDLYYRLNVFPIQIPPLRERSEDVPLLVMAFLSEFSKKMGKKIQTVSRKTMDALQSYKWPGNIRELRNVIEQAVIVSRGDGLNVSVPDSTNEITPLDRNLRDVQYRHIVEVLEATGWKIKGRGGAAEILGVKPSTLYTKMENLNIPTRQEKVAIAAHKT